MRTAAASIQNNSAAAAICWNIQNLLRIVVEVNNLLDQSSKVIYLHIINTLVHTIK